MPSRSRHSRPTSTDEASSGSIPVGFKRIIDVLSYSMLHIVMDTDLRGILWSQFGASIDMLERSVRECPDDVWNDRSSRPEYWYLAYHTLFWMDLYLFGSVEGFEPPAPFSLEELDPAGIVPERPYTQGELLRYLEHLRATCRATIEGLDDERGRARCVFPWGDVTFTELLLYNLRHVQHHAAQLYLLLRQRTDSAPIWVARAAAHSSGARRNPSQEME